MNQRFKNLLLSLLNATLLLAVILVLCVTLLVHKLESFAGDVINDVTTSLLHEARQDIDRTVSSIDDADRELRRLTSIVSELIDKPVELLSSQDIKILTTLRSEVARTNLLIAEVTTLHGNLSDRTIHQIASSIAELIVNVRKCEPIGDV